MTPYSSLGLVSSAVMLATPGKIYGVTVSVAAAGSYWLIVLDAAAVPADAQDVTSASYKRVTISKHTTSGPDEVIDIDYTVGGGSVSESGVVFATGATILLSSTAPTSITKVASGMQIDLAEFG